MRDDDNCLLAAGGFRLAAGGFPASAIGSTWLVDRDKQPAP